jgi:uncharacterized protein YndB with AHSA1/START domain
MTNKILVGLAVIVACFVGFFFYAKSTTKVVVIEHTFKAPVAKVWQTWNDPEMMKKWWGPKGFTAPVIKNDLRVDGQFLLSMQDTNGSKPIYNAGKYTEIIENKKISSTMSFADENGNPVPPSQYSVPGNWADTTTVTVEFEEGEGKTYVKITETGIPMIMYVFAKLGWSQQFDKFDDLIK